MVDENRIQGAVKDAVGKVEDAVGGLTGDVETQATGKSRQTAGQLQTVYGKAADEVRGQPIVALLLAVAVGFFLGRMSLTDKN
jgi:uncharacterized protein YjbJ (UPF0337 family)